KLGIESLTLDVSGQKATNCAVPCYFTACNLVPGTDPPGTYKPCAQTRLELDNWPPNSSRGVKLQLQAPDGSMVVSQNFTMDASPESVVFWQLPLYTTGNVPLPPGTYQLSAARADGSA